MDRWLHVSPPSSPLPPGLAEDDVRYSDELVRAFIDEYTALDDLVVDPFAGFGTTLLVAARAGRRAVGVELLEERVSFIRARLPPGAAVHCADARSIDALGIDDIQLVMTSPPYMTSNDHPQNPMTGYRCLDGDYKTYLADLERVFASLRERLTGDGRVVVNVANIRHDGITTPLAWDVQRALSGVLSFDHEVVIVNDQLPQWITQEYCLVFRR